MRVDIELGGIVSEFIDMGMSHKRRATFQVRGVI